MKYRGDIDGLRAIAVLVVIAFHAEITTFAGGFIGVDVFFVISGYLITTLLTQEMQQQRFSFANFYKRRISRLLPALAITLFVVLCLGFVFYHNYGFNHLGKQTFFSALGAANLFFAAGDDYFASGVANQPLIHLWSLGVEEQFYVVWPVVLLLVYRFKPRWLMATTVVLLLASLIASELAAQQQTPASYFLPHYRAFELLIGALTAMLLQRYDPQVIANGVRSLLGALGLVFIIVPIITLDKHSVFPGVNALLPCIGTALLIAFPSDSLLNKFLSHKLMVVVGLISYPLYLYHQPMISFLHLSTIELAPWTLFALVTLVTGTLAWLTYQYIETPIRRMTSRGSVMKKRVTVTGLVMTLPVFAVLGFGVAKTDGFPQRFEWLNPYAATIDGAHKMPFHQQFSEGWQVDTPPQGKILFVGDSVMQQYVEPMALALGYEKSQIELVTRGMCVLLKGADYADQIASISCDDLRDKLYSLDTHYEHVVISQAWQGYDDDVKNYSPNATNLFDRWQSLLSNTVKHFQQMSEQVIVVGMHPIIEGTGGIRSRMLITPERYQEQLKMLKFAHPERLEQGRDFFHQFSNLANVNVIHPEDIFCQETCVFSGEQWSYFGDSVHISTAAIPFVERRFQALLTSAGPSEELQ
ncbi:acyltransferase [Pseudidiomarina sp. 1APP75-27a]|uniref:acyltransferase family protein n=1 Tax=Pseudidiomarina terrestris TaxID=2820060 RepID=UPI002B054979|nr:acyltransferase family protein [Pseudidiomarina sp. 1APP75-27a]MEA3587705.1 acyltransferase [Pseudidiomarina sp. 1APP75-27a]